MIINSTHLAIQNVHFNIDNVLKHLWFNNLSDYEFTVTDDKLRKRIKKLYMESQLYIDDVEKNSIFDPVLSSYLNTTVLYLWGKQRASLFKLIYKVCNYDIKSRLHMPFVLLNFDGESFVLVNYFDNEYGVDEGDVDLACRYVQFNWYTPTTKGYISEQKKYDYQYIYQNEIILFIIRHMYADYGFRHGVHDCLCNLYSDYSAFHGERWY